MNLTKCKSCGARAYWIALKSGKFTLVNADMKTVITPTGDVVKGHESHFASCPQSSEWRRNLEARRAD